jgi:LysM repeat protein
VIVPATICLSATSGRGIAAVAPLSFLFHCAGGGLQVSYRGKTVLQATSGQILEPLQTAVVTGRNQPIVSAGGYSLWALKSSEYQAHIDRNPDGTKLVVSSAICSLFASSTTTTTITTTAPATVQQPTTTGGRTYVVQAGDNLFRIALRFGTTWPVLAAANSLANPNLIYAGQVLVIP